jgi:hypothetical protein
VPPTRLLVPAVTQWESPELVADILAGRMRAADDPRWASSGAADPEDYDFWSWRICGMACLEMALRHWLGGRRPLVELAREALDHGAYVRRDGGLHGLVYAPFVGWVGQRFGLDARSEPDLTLDALGAALDDGCLVVLSVHPGIRDPASTPPSRGGHLVLVTGRAPGGAVLNNPSGDRPETQEGAVVGWDDLARFSAGRGILLRCAPRR